MSRNTWIKQPSTAKDTCNCKALQSVAKKYKQNSKVNWHKVQFDYLSVVARVVQTVPTLILSDNTSVYHYESFKDFPNKEIYIQTVYYRFIFQLTPYSVNLLKLIKSEAVTAKEMLAHMMNTISEEMFASAHEKIMEMKSENEDWGKNSDLSAVREAVRGMTTFNFKDIKEKTDLPDKSIEAALEKMCDNEEIGNLGSHYMVVNLAEDSEKGRLKQEICESGSKQETALLE